MGNGSSVNQNHVRMQFIMAEGCERGGIGCVRGLGQGSSGDMLSTAGGAGVDQVRAGVSILVEPMWAWQRDVWRGIGRTTGVALARALAAAGFNKGDWAEIFDDVNAGLSEGFHEEAQRQFERGHPTTRTNWAGTTEGFDVWLQKVRRFRGEQKLPQNVMPCELCDGHPTSFASSVGCGARGEIQCTTSVEESEVYSIDSIRMLQASVQGSEERLQPGVCANDFG